MERWISPEAACAPELLEAAECPPVDALVEVHTPSGSTPAGELKGLIYSEDELLDLER
jgi:hypothetical protein